MQKCTHQRRREWPQLELKMLVYEILGGHCTRKTFRCKRSTLHLKWLSPSHVRNKFYNALSPLQQQTFSFCANIYLKKRGASGEPCGTPRKLSCPSRLSENCAFASCCKANNQCYNIFPNKHLFFIGTTVSIWGASTGICEDWAQLSRNWHKCNGVKKKKKKKKLNQTTLSVNAAHSPVLLVCNGLTYINACARNYSTALYRRTSWSICKLGACLWGAPDRGHMCRMLNAERRNTTLPFVLSG